MGDSRQDRLQRDLRRADQLAVERGLAPTRSRAQAIIRMGKLRCAGRVVDKAGELLPGDAELDLAAPDHPWVSRGGVKLSEALRRFTLSPRNRVCLDLGASTGGFTEVLLAEGATRVYAVDVGHDQLAPALRADPRVISLEGVNARNLDRSLLPEPLGAIVCDVSFISARKVLDPAFALAASDCWLLVLVKPQFEVGQSGVGKHGVVRSEALRRQACDEIMAWLSERGWGILGVADSPLLGRRGNREYLLAARRGS